MEIDLDSLGVSQSHGTTMHVYGEREEGQVLFYNNYLL